MGLLYKKIHENGAIELQFNQKLNQLNLQNFLTIPGIKLHSCQTKITITPTLNGGKGASRQLLRNVGRTMNRSMNQSMARDLNGRRIRDIENEKRLQRWIDEHAERQANKEMERTRKLEVLARISRGEKDRKRYIDENFDREGKEMMDQMTEAVKASFVVEEKEEQFCLVTGVRNQRIDPNGVVLIPRKKMKFGFDEEDMTDSEDEDVKNNNKPGKGSGGLKKIVEESELDQEDEPADDTKHGEAAEEDEPEEEDELLQQIQQAEQEKKLIDENLKKLVEMEKLKNPAKKVRKSKFLDFRDYEYYDDDYESVAAEVETFKEPEKPKTPPKPKNFKPINIKKIRSKEGFKKYESEHLKFELNRRGLKAGGTDEQRIHRLFYVRTLKWDKIPKKFKNPKLC